MTFSSFLTIPPLALEHGAGYKTPAPMLQNLLVPHHGPFRHTPTFSLHVKASRTLTIEMVFECGHFPHTRKFDSTLTIREKSNSERRIVPSVVLTEPQNSKYIKQIAWEG